MCRGTQDCHLISCLSEDSTFYWQVVNERASRDWCTHTCKVTRNVLYQAQPSELCQSGSQQASPILDGHGHALRSASHGRGTALLLFSFFFRFLIIRKLMAMAHGLLSRLGFELLCTRSGSSPVSRGPRTPRISGCNRLDQGTSDM